MGEELAKAYAAAREVFRIADNVLGFELSALCWNGPKEALDDTYNTQPALYVCGIAALRALEEAAGAGFRPAFMAGHSLGEITALVCAGALDFEDGLDLVRQRGRLMKLAGEREPGGMAAVLTLELDMLIEICAQASSATGSPVDVANDNCPGQVVISGHNYALDRAIKLALDAGAKRVIRLPVSVAAHSPLMESVVEEYSLVVDSKPFLEPQISVIANTTVLPLETPTDIRAELCDQLTSPVRWTETVQFLLEQGMTDFIELGSGKVLTSLLRRVDRDAIGYAVAAPDAIKQITEL